MAAFASSFQKFVSIRQFDRISGRIWRVLHRVALALIGATVMSMASVSQAAVVQGVFVLEDMSAIPTVDGVEDLINTQLGSSLELLQLTDKIGDGSETSAYGALTVSSATNSFGDWSFAPTGGNDVDFILLKYDGMIAIWDYRVIGLADINTGCWSTEFQDNFNCVDPDTGSFPLTLSGSGPFNMTHLVAFSVVPIPAAGWLFLTALIGLWIVRRRHSHATTAA